VEEKFLWQFYWDCGRQGSVEGLFVASEYTISRAIGKQVNFGEILGKHSEIYGTLDREDLTKIDVDSDAIEQLIPYLGLEWSGYCPLSYIRCEECGESQDFCECK
jgi:hypothetical protein